LTRANVVVKCPWSLLSVELSFLKGYLLQCITVVNGLKPFTTNDCMPERQVKGPPGSPKRSFVDSTCIYPFLSNLGKMSSLPAREWTKWW
jgi:hypothetical protein